MERRRRDKINNWIVQLSKIIPDCNADNSKTGAVSALGPSALWRARPPTPLRRVCLTARGGSRPGLSRWAAAGWRCPLMLMPTPQSKGGILSKACDYIRELRQTNQRMQETFKEAERLQMDNELLRQQVSGRAGRGAGRPREPRAAGSQPWLSVPRRVWQIEELKNENAVLRAQLQQHNLEMVGESARQ